MTTLGLSMGYIVDPILEVIGDWLEERSRFGFTFTFALPLPHPEASTKNQTAQPRVPLAKSANNVESMIERKLT